jgi:ABC-type phosphate transport system substrate-binding protein
MKNTFVVIFLMLVMLCLGSTTSFADVLIIANKNVSEDSISKEEVKNIFLGKTVKWLDKSSISFVILKNDVHKDFLKEYIKRSSSQYGNYWKKMVFTGKGSKPKAFETEKDLVRYVAETKGAIGYINKGTEMMNVKTINVN